MTTTLNHEIKAALKDYILILEVLYEDSRLSSSIALADASNFNIRSFIRTFFALVEGSLYGLKQLCLKVNTIQPCFSDGEITILREESFEVSERGIVKTKAKYIDTLANVRFTFNSVAKAFKLNYTAKYDTSGWQSFREALLIRHSITHPKSIRDFTISEKDDGKGRKVDVVVEAFSWYAKEITTLSKEIEAAISI